MQEEPASCGTILCRKCRGRFAAEDRITSISGSIMGDEVTDSWFLCPACQVYTVVQWWDDFTGLETMDSSGPISKQEGDERVDMIRKCLCPWDKKCRCDAHRTYFRDTLD